MAGEANTVGAGKALDAITGRATQTARTMYLALLTAAPGDGTTVANMAELTTAGYSRQVYTPSAPSGDPAVSSNTNTITYGPFTADPPPVTHAALVSTVSGTAGEVTYFWAWDAARDAISGDSLVVAPGAASLSLD